MSPVATISAEPTQPASVAGPDTPFRARIVIEQGQRAARGRVQVRQMDERSPGSWTSAWEPIPAGATELVVEQPGQPILPVGPELRWRAQVEDQGRKPGPWSDWQTFSISRAAPRVEPKPLGTVDSLEGAELAATVFVPSDATSITRYEIQIAPRRARQDPRLWEKAERFEGVPPGMTAPTEPVARFESIDGRPGTDQLVIGRVRPEVTVRATSPVKSFRWKLWQHSDLLATGSRTLRGGERKRTCFTLRLPVVARRGVGYFAPPFKPPAFRRHGKRIGSYRGETYKPGNIFNPAGHSAYAVDFNRGDGGDDAGDPVLAAAAGWVADVDETQGLVVLDHPGGLRTEYAHMQPASIPPRIRSFRERRPEKVRVRALEEIGTIGDTGVPGAVHLHHRHRKLNTRGPLRGAYKPIKMRHGGKSITVSAAGPIVASFDYDGWKSDFEDVVHGFEGWRSFSPLVRLQLWLTWDDDQESRRHELRFFVANQAELQAIGIEAGCGVAGHSVVPIRIRHLVEGLRLKPGRYSIRYRCTDDVGSHSPWAEDHSLVVRA